MQEHQLPQRDHDVAAQSSQAVAVEIMHALGLREQRGDEVRLEAVHGLAPGAGRDGLELHQHVRDLDVAVRSMVMLDLRSSGCDRPAATS